MKIKLRKFCIDSGCETFVMKNACKRNGCVLPYIEKWLIDNDYEITEKGGCK